MHLNAKKWNKVLFLGILLILSPFFNTSATDQGVNAPQQILKSYDLTPSEDADTLTTIQNRIESAVQQRNQWLSLKENYHSDVEKARYLVFASNEAEFEWLQELQVDQLYPNLRAAKIYLSQTEMRLASSIFERGVFSAESVENAVMYTQAFKQVELPSPIKVNALEDADLMNVVPLWDLGYNGTGVVVGVVDNGVNFNHPALAHAFHSYANFYPPGIPGEKGHGTPVAGNIAADGTGAEPNETFGRGNAFGAKIAAAELGSPGGNAVAGDFIGAFDYMIGLGDVDVINFSIGGEFNWMESVLERMEEANIVFVTSAGNSGTGGSSVRDPFSNGGPGSSIHTISVGATTHTLSLASFSSEGPGDWGVQKPDVVAPGVDIYSTSASGGWNLNSGTSFSSPLTAGAIATVISALEANNVSWTVGAIKAALRRTANDIGLPEAQQGSGFVNAKAMFDYLMSLPRDANNVPKVFDVGPREGPMSYFHNIPQGEILNIPISVYTSQLPEINFTLSGNVTDFVTVSIPNPGLFSSHIVNLVADTASNNVSQGTYIGSLIATLENDTLTVPLKINVKPPAKGRIYMDYYYTVFDEYQAIGPASRYTGSAINALVQAGYWVETFNEPFDATKASQFDVAWFYSPFGDEIGSGFFSGTMTQADLNEINTFVNQGGSLFVNLNSPKDPNEEDSYGGNQDVSEVNAFLGQFGISMPQTVDTELISEQRPVELINGNSTVLGYHTTEILAEGFSLQLSGNAEPVAEDEAGNIVIAQNSLPGRGRVLVSSGVNWLSSFYLSSPEKLPHAASFIVDLFDYLSLDHQIEVISETITPSSMDVTVQAFTNNTPVTTQPSIRIVDNEFVNGISPNITDLGNGTYRVMVDFTVEGFYNLQVAIDTEYAVITGLKDIKGPVITTRTSQDRNYSISLPLVLYQFKLDDDFSGVDLSSIIVTLDGSTSGFDLSIDNSTNQIFISFAPGSLDNSLAEHHLIVKANDFYGNEGSLDMRFFIYGTPPTSTTESPTPTTTTNSTTSETSSTTPSESSPVALFVVLLGISFVSMMQMLDKRRKS